MKILLLTNTYPPEIGGAANLCLELAQVLTQRGHLIKVVTRFPRNLPKELLPNTSKKMLQREKRLEGEVIRIYIPKINRKIPFVRELDNLLHMIMLAWASFKSGPVDVVMTSSPPLVMGYAAVIIGIIKKAKVVFNVQDIFPQNLVDLGILTNKYLIALSRFLEKDLYRKADWITVMSEGNREIIAKTSRTPDKISTVENWIDINYIIPEKKENGIRLEYGLSNRFVLFFGGAITDSQDMEIILLSAKILENYKDIVFLLAGNGPKYEYTIRRKHDLGLRNVLIIPVQPREKYVKLLAASDVGIVTLNPLVATPTVPSKIKSIMAAARPVLASLPLAGDAPKLIWAAKCGIVVAAGDTRSFCSAILKLYKDPELCQEYGNSGRYYVVDHLSALSGAKAYEEIFSSLLLKRRTRSYVEGKRIR